MRSQTPRPSPPLRQTQSAHTAARHTGGAESWLQSDPFVVSCGFIKENKPSLELDTNYDVV